MSHSVEVATEEAMRQLGASLAPSLRVGDAVLLSGPLGAGKTTLVRGVLASLGYSGPVRSPTFNLIQTYAVDPPVMHADLYRVQTWQGIGLEDYLDDHVCLIEWPDRAEGLVDPQRAWRVSIEFAEHGRTVNIEHPRRA